MDYFALKHIHMTLAAISLAGFLLRSIWRFTDSEWLQRRWVKIVPHIIDSLLLAAGIWLVFKIQYYPDWLTVKLIALVVYIGAGMVTLKYTRSTASRLLACAISVGAFAYMMAVAISKQAIPF